MARNMSAEDDEVFRVTVQRHISKYTFGPYRTLGAARACATRETYIDWYTGKKVGEATIERGRITWEAVDG